MSLKKTLMILIILASLSLAGCGSKAGETSADFKNDDVLADYVEKETAYEKAPSDKQSFYEDEDDLTVIKMYLTVSSGNKADGSDHTWAEVNKYSAYYYDNLGVDRYKVEGILKIDDGNGLTKDSFGYGEDVPNVSVQIRGQTSTTSAEKNYKIRIKDGKGEYEGQRTLNLNKHYTEPFRFVNKLCYDLIEDVPELIGGRTRFVNLYVCDTTEGGDKEFHDYGLYTMVEQVNKTYLKSRGFDDKGQLYKVTFFEWYKYDAVTVPYDSEEFDVDAFEEYMEIKGDADNSKLVTVLDDVTNYAKPIEDVINEHFDAKNLCYWMAMNILLGNPDAGARNLFLYSPLNSEKFYVICWDLDVSLVRDFREYKGYIDGGSWEQGMHHFLGLSLVNRMMKEEKYRDMLTDAIEDLYQNYITNEKVSSLSNDYSEIVKPYLYGLDSSDAIISEDIYDELVVKMGDQIDSNYQIYYDTLNCPWPFFIGLPEEDRGNLKISWDASFDPNYSAITYSVYVARDYYFEDVIFEKSGLASPAVTIDKPLAGTYYVRVIAINESGYSMDAFDYYSVDKLGKIYNCLCFVLNEDGTIEQYLGDE